MKKVWSMFMLLAVCLVACTNIDDLEDDVDALKKRVTALETQVRDINSNTEALRELYNEGTFITNIEEKSGEKGCFGGSRYFSCCGGRTASRMGEPCRCRYDRRAGRSRSGSCNL